MSERTNFDSRYWQSHYLRADALADLQKTAGMPMEAPTSPAEATERVEAASAPVATQGEDKPRCKTCRFWTRNDNPLGRRGLDRWGNCQVLISARVLIAAYDEPTDRPDGYHTIEDWGCALHEPKESEVSR